MSLHQSVATNGNDGRGLKLERKMPSFNAAPARISQKLLSLLLPDEISLILSRSFCVTFRHA